MTVAAINRRTRLAILDSGAVVPISNMIDIDGYETDNPDECLHAIVQLPCGTWECCDMRDFENVKSH